MASLVVIVPTRGRPQNARTLADAYRQTTLSDTELLFVVDFDDEKRDEYLEIPGMDILVTKTSGMVKALNFAAKHIIDKNDTKNIGFMGDDHFPRTHGWDVEYITSLDEMRVGMVYGNDCLQARALPTQVAMTTNIVKAIGYMALPSLVHLYVDNFWKVLGEQSECIHYLPNVIIEHRHPLSGKADWDEGYARVNSESVYSKDAYTFGKYVKNGLNEDVRKVKALRLIEGRRSVGS